jgi:hypothetical protein
MSVYFDSSENSNVEETKSRSKEPKQPLTLQGLAASLPRRFYKMDPESADKSLGHLLRQISNEKVMAVKRASFIEKIYPSTPLELAGVAITATYLKEKKGLTNLFVCASADVLQAQVANIRQMPGDVRAAFIVHECSEGNDDKDDDFFHCSVVGVEKKGSALKIVHLDALGADQVTWSADGTGLAEKYVEDIVMKFRDDQTELYVIEIERQSSENGCESFALRDAVAFLEDPQFFDKIQTKKQVGVSEGKEFECHEITALPPAFMRGTQSIKILDAYFAAHSGKNSADEISALKKSLAKHVHPIAKGRSKQRNYYIVERTLKYQSIMMSALKYLSKQEVKSIISKSLIVDATPPPPLAIPARAKL